MKKEIVLVDKEKGVYRVTTQDERWYTQETKDEVSGLPVFKFIPSVTWICGFYPKGVQFYKWLASKGWDEAEAIKTAAGDKGSKVHKAIENIIAGGTVKMEDMYVNNSTGKSEELSVEEYEAIMSFVTWADEAKPKFLLTEATVTSEKYGFSGTVDCVAKIKDDVYIIDFKTSQNIWQEYEMQISAYKQALTEMGYKTENIKLAFLQIGYKGNRTKKDGSRTMHKFTMVDDKFELFLHARAIWANETEGQKPKQAEYPLSLSLKIEPKVEEKVEVAPAPKVAPKKPAKVTNEAIDESKLTNIKK